MKKMTIARNVAIVATCIIALSVIITPTNFNLGDRLGVIGFFAGILSYILGGIGSALKKVWGIAVKGWYLIPIFPIDVLFFLMSLGVAVMIFVYVPIIPIMMSYKEKASLEEA